MIDDVGDFYRCDIHRFPTVHMIKAHPQNHPQIHLCSGKLKYSSAPYCKIDVRPSSSGQNFFIFMQFPGRIVQIVVWHPLKVAAIPQRNPGSATANYAVLF